MPILYDQHCFSLAETFLGDNGITRWENVDELAGRIQLVIEDYIKEVKK